MYSPAGCYVSFALRRRERAISFLAGAAVAALAFLLFY
jgi:hypothetical protein